MVKEELVYFWVIKCHRDRIFIRVHVHAFYLVMFKLMCADTKAVYNDTNVFNCQLKCVKRCIVDHC